MDFLDKSIIIICAHIFVLIPALFRYSFGAIMVQNPNPSALTGIKKKRKFLILPSQTPLTSGEIV